MTEKNTTLPAPRKEDWKNKERELDQKLGGECSKTQEANRIKTI